ncbi:hypothetical protein QE443_004797 [Pantoea ananatis]|nr:hypothetical protein [Pantoea ananatis]MDR6092689.1 hypothetical protein [Pantoea ananatis]PWV60344.1 hypothetical protein C7425_1125 [Pantoea ananatis]
MALTRIRKSATARVHSWSRQAHITEKYPANNSLRSLDENVCSKLLLTCRLEMFGKPWRTF